MFAVWVSREPSTRLYAQCKRKIDAMLCVCVCVWSDKNRAKLILFINVSAGWYCNATNDGTNTRTVCEGGCNKGKKWTKKNIQSNFVVHVLRCWLGSGRAVLREARGGLSARAACRQLRREGCQRIQVRARDQWHKCTYDLFGCAYQTLRINGRIVQTTPSPAGLPSNRCERGRPYAIYRSSTIQQWIKTDDNGNYLVPTQIDRIYRNCERWVIVMFELCSRPKEMHFYAGSMTFSHPCSVCMWHAISPRIVPFARYSFASYLHSIK